MADYEPWTEDQARSIIADFAGQEGASLPILHALQATFGCIPLDAEPLVASALNITRAEVHGIVTFYHEFRRTVPGRHVLHVCRAEACQAVGGDASRTHMRSALAVDWHGTPADGAVTLEPVFCLGLCATGPAALLDGKPVGRLNAARSSTACWRLDLTRVLFRVMRRRWRSAPMRWRRRLAEHADVGPDRLTRAVLAGTDDRGRNAGRAHRLWPGRGRRHPGLLADGLLTGTAQHLRLGVPGSDPVPGAPDPADLRPLRHCRSACRWTTTAPMAAWPDWKRPARSVRPRRWKPCWRRVCAAVAAPVFPPASNGRPPPTAKGEPQVHRLQRR